MAFGESFGAVENAEGHPWVTAIKKNLYAALFFDIFRRVPLLKILPSLVRPKDLLSFRKEHFRFSHEKVVTRMKNGNGRGEDFFAHLLSEKATDLTPIFLAAQANTLVVAGSETTATFLAGKASSILSSVYIKS